jgi:Na+-driven multidrug efflux pump
MSSVPAVLILLVGYGACLGRQDARTPLVLNMVAALINLVGDFVFTLRYQWYALDNTVFVNDFGNCYPKWNQ